MIRPESCRILLVDDEEGIRFTLSCLLIKEGYLVDVASGHADAIICLQKSHYDLAFIDIMLAGESGIDLLHDIKVLSPATQVVMFTACPEVSTATEAVRLGAFDYISKPVYPKTLLSISRLALNEKRMKDEQKRHQIKLDAIFRTVSDSIVMVDKEGRLAHFNISAGNICGYTNEMIGNRLESVGFGCGGECRRALLQTVRDNASRELRRFECSLPGRPACVVSFKSTPITEADGTVNGAVAVIRDETPLVELEHSLKKRGQFYDIIGVSDSMQRVYSLIEALADVPTTVLINGESGTGKELVAAALHFGGSRAKEPFVKVNCSALSETLLESELFGHVRGAFTGAFADKVGRFQKAHRGTLFLDEIGDISSAIQMRLLRVLQESEFERVGESKPTKVDVRIIAATNQNLTEMVRQGTFRHDLYYRLNVVRMELPSLRERREDISLLADHFLALFNTRFGKNIRALSDEAMKLLQCHTWPGNVRELEHALEHAVIMCRSEIITVQDLPHDLIDLIQNVKHSPAKTEPCLTLDQALEMSDGNITRAARLLGVSRPTVYRHLKGKECCNGTAMDTCTL
ncbi:MAG: sigma-54-dependent Fis family transcriptional regulator [Desulfuromonadaceae bacterium]|nr:sigma-54-dependent Fis family transcriptional regulator [Desulfuromonadaceae bacterium]